jgi:hypothetical protein
MPLYIPSIHAQNAFSRYRLGRGAAPGGPARDDWASAFKSVSGECLGAIDDTYLLVRVGKGDPMVCRQDDS